MKTTRQKKGKTVEASKTHIATTGFSGVQKSRKRNSGGHQKTTGECEYVLTGEDPGNLPFSSAQVLGGKQLPNRVTSIGETTKTVPALELKAGQLHPSLKIKLQLFPIDECTRLGLEKDGHNPFLELTLSARKKISSVLKHLNNKWGSSSVAQGDPVLFPYNVQLENLASCRRWSLNDCGISAGDVHEAIESPVIFRLRYGWFSNVELETFVVPSSSMPLEDDEVKIEDSLAQSTVPWDDSLTNLSIGGLLSEASLQGKINNCDPESNGCKSDLHPTKDKGPVQSLLPWDDSLTTLSIGGLLSEASLQGKINTGDPKSDGSRSGFQPTVSISDSFDAFIAGQINSHPQVLKPSSHELHSSILDAEETCHAFFFRNFSSSAKDVVGFGGSANSRGSNHDGSPKPFKFPNFAELKNQTGLVQDSPFQESNTDLTPRSRVYNDESSLGLTGIKWNDSLGPFDLGPSTSPQITSEDSFSSIGGFVR
ncbi:TSL-kinase interacting protein 1 isoform X2 [Cornus florida]|uniref:TSL-kinase interacting protein 1 isoform X2 n=1 Tax=Cornus florida TaxID=4283 RepID=UPI0028984279|nr:TSL-kinase interacting protein 1 isoform X2 [Cornus florida]